jgi:short chain dehydrogenase
MSPSAQPSYSNPNQEERYATAKREHNQRYLDITSVYDPSFLQGKRVAVTGCNRGLGLALATEVALAGAHLVAIARSTSSELEALHPAELILDIDVSNTTETDALAHKITGGPIDIVRMCIFLCVCIYACTCVRVKG